LFENIFNSKSKTLVPLLSPRISERARAYQPWEIGTERGPYSSSMDERISTAVRCVLFDIDLSKSQQKRMSDHLCDSSSDKGTSPA
jgi:hypothetical protein